MNERPRIKPIGYGERPLKPNHPLYNAGSDDVYGLLQGGLRYGTVLKCIFCSAYLHIYETYELSDVEMTYTICCSNLECGARPCAIDCSDRFATVAEAEKNIPFATRGNGLSKI